MDSGARSAAQCGTGAGEFEKCGECVLGSEASCCVCRRRWVGTELWGTQRYSSATDICPCTDKMEKAKQAAAEAKAKVEAAVKKPPREWETGICGCFEDFGGCKPVHSTLLGRYAARGSFAIWPTNRAPAFAGCMGLWCPCVVSYQLAPEADSSAILCCLGYVSPRECSGPTTASSLSLHVQHIEPYQLTCSWRDRTLSCATGVPIFLISGCCLRQNYREAKNIQGGTLDDFLCGGVLHQLNLCQMAREVSGASSSGVARMER